jgi:polar amino acid transport system substrate-binding protein
MPLLGAPGGVGGLIAAAPSAYSFLSAGSRAGPDEQGGRVKHFSITALMALVVLVLLSGCSGVGGDDSMKDIKQKGVIVLGLDGNFPPMGFRDAAGEIGGFDIDLAKEAAKRLGVTIKPQPLAWDGIIQSLNKKDIDVIWNGLTITEERSRQIGFSKPYLENRQIIVVKAGSAIATKADLAGKVVGLQKGSSSVTALEADAPTKASLKEVRQFPDNVVALMDLAAGRVDAVVVDEIIGRFYLAKKPGEYQVLAEDFGKESYGVGFRAADKAFGAELDRVLDEMKKDGSAGEISQKWFGEDIVLK